MSIYEKAISSENISGFKIAQQHFKYFNLFCVIHMKFLSMNSNMIFPFDVYLEWLFFLEWLNWKVQLNSNRNVISIEFFCKCFNQINESYLNVCIKIQRILTFCALLHENAALYIPIINDIQMNSIEKYAVTATHCIL